MTTEAIENPTKTSEEIVEETSDELAENKSGHGEPPSDSLQALTSGGASGGMGLSRGNLLMLALLLVQAGLATYMLWPQSSVGEAGTPLLNDVASSAVSGLTIIEGDNEIGFEKAGDDWAIAGTGGFLTNNDSDGVNKVAAILEKLVAIDGNRLVTKTPSSHKRLQVAEDDFVRKVIMTTTDGDQTLYIGSSAGSGATHVRLDGSDNAYLTNEVSSFELNTGTSSWIDTQYFSLQSDDVTAFTLENGNGTFSFERGKTEADGSLGPWILEDLADGETLDQTKVNTLINQTANLRMTMPVGTREEDEFGLDSEGANVTFTVQESGESTNPEPQTITLLIGSSPEESMDYYAKTTNSDFVVLISQFNGNQILDKTRGDFLAEPEDAEAVDDSQGAEVVDSAGSEGVFTVTEPITSTDEITATEGISATEDVTTTEAITE